MIIEKLQVLVENNVISKLESQMTLDAGDLLIKENIISQYDQAEVFLTHFAMALSRSEELPAMESFVKKQILTNDFYEKAKRIWHQIYQNLKVEIDPNEADYMILHLIQLLDKEASSCS